jgi:hypothetical protein
MAGETDTGPGRSWFAIDGQLEAIDYDGPSFFRFPEAVAQYAIERYSKAGDWVLDPFCGFGTTLVEAERLGRHAVGFEVDERRAAFAASRVPEPSRVIHAPSDEAASTGGYTPFSLLFTSPPAISMTIRPSISRMRADSSRASRAS